MKRAEQIEFKRELLDNCYRQLDKSLADLKREMDDAQKAANDYGTPKDRYDAFRNQQMRRKDMMAQQYQKTLEQKDLLMRIDPEQDYDQAVFGAVVFSSKQMVFISISLGKISVQGKDIFAISPQVPFFEAIHQKKEGEEFEFRGSRGKIVSLF